MLMKDLQVFILKMRYLQHLVEWKILVKSTVMEKMLQE